MSYTMADFMREHRERIVSNMTPEELRLAAERLPPEERLRGLPPEERLRGLTPQERQRLKDLLNQSDD